MGHFKKSISVLLAALMLLSVFALGADAAETKKAPTGGMFKTIEFKSDKTATVTVMDYDGYHEGALAGVSYNEESNTLTLDNVNLPDKYLEVYFMGNDFQVNVVGECALSYISAYHSCLDITGTGSLVLSTSAPYGIEFKPAFDNYYPSALSVGKSVNLSVTCSESAIKFFHSSVNFDLALTIGGVEIEELNTDNEYSEDVVKKVKAGNYYEYGNAYLMTCSDAEGDFCGLEYYDSDEDTNYFEIHKCTYNEKDGKYYLDTSSGDDKVYTADLESSKYSLVKKDDDRVKIPCKELQYWGEMEVYENDVVTDCVINWSDDVYTFSQDNMTDYNGAKIYVLTRNDEINASDLSPALTGETVEYYDYSYGGKKFETEGAIERGARPSIYLDSANEETLLVVKTLAGFKNMTEVTEISYDSESNTLTLDNFKAPDAKLVAYYMGSDLKLNVKGVCELGQITVNNGGLSVIGDGFLVVDSSEDYGLRLDQGSQVFYDSKLAFSEDTGYRIKGKTAAYCINNTTDKEDETGLKNIKKTAENKKQFAKAIDGVELSAWSGGFGFRYKIKNSNEPGEVFCGQYTKTTKMNAYGNPDTVIETWDLKRVRYDEGLSRYIIVESIGELDGVDFANKGFSVVANGSTPVQLVCYYALPLTCEVYSDSDSKNYAVKGTDVYDFSEEKTYEDENGEKAYVLERNESVKVDGLTPVMDESVVYSYAYDGTEITNKEQPETEPDTQAPTSENPTEAPTSAPGNEPTEPGQNPTNPAGTKFYVGGVEVTSANASGVTGEGIKGKVTFDAATNTLTLDNAEITSAYLDTSDSESSLPFMGGVFCDGSLNIRLIGENKIEVTDAVTDTTKDYNLYGVIVKGALTFTGSGKLTTDGIITNTLKVEKDADVDSSVTVGMKVRLRNAVMAETINVEGKLYAECTTVFLDYPAIAAKNFTVAQGAEVTVYASNLIPSTPAPHAAKGISIMNGGTLTINGNVNITVEGTIAGDASSSQKNNGYGIYGENDGSKVVLGNTGNLTVLGKASAVRNIEFTVPDGIFEIKAGSNAENADEVALTGINSQKYISFKTTYVPPVTEPSTEEPETNPGGKPTDPGENPTTPGSKPTEPGEKPTTPTDKPTQPGENPTTPGDNPAQPGENPTTPTDKPTQPGETPTETQPSGTTRVFNYLPSKEQLAEGDSIKLVVQDENGAFVSYELSATPLVYDGIPVYTTNLPSDIKPVALQIQVYKDNAFKSQVTVTKDQFEAAKDKIMTSDGKTYEEQKQTQAEKKKQPMKVSAKSQKIKVKKLKKGAQKISPLKVTKAKGKVSYKLIKKGSSKKIFSLLSISKTGKITINKWKQARKGKYTIVVKATAKGTKTYKKGSKTVKVKLTLN